MKNYFIIIWTLIVCNLCLSQVVKFAAIGDYGGFTTNGGAGELAVANLVKSWDTDTSFFIITLGDNNYYPTTQADETIDPNIGQFYHQYIYPYNSAGFSPGYYPNPQRVNRFFPAMGNHDFYGNPLYSYYLYFQFTNIHKGNSNEYPGGIRYYDFQKGNVQFFVLNSGIDPPNHDFISEPDGLDSNSMQGQWLKTKLLNSTAKWKIVYFHHPPYFSLRNYPPDSYSMLRYPKQWGANVVLGGHLHTYERLYLDGVTYIINGLGGDSDGADSIHEPGIPGSIVRYSSNFGALLANAYADSLVFKFINIDHELIDYCKVLPFSRKIFVNDNSQTGDVYSSAVGNDANTGTSISPYATISHAITVASAGDTIYVDAGTYSENPTVNKSLVIYGSNKGTAGQGARVAESIVRTNGNQNAVFTVSAGNITIDGFKINGDDPGVIGVTTASGDDANAVYGVRPIGTVNNLSIRNNIVSKVIVGFRGDSSSSGNLITRNWFDRIGNYNFGYAVSLRSGFYADLTNNKMTGVWTGIHTNDFHLSGGPALWTISGNEIHSYAAGLCYWLQYQSATNLTVDNNHFFAESGAVTNNFGILVTSIQNALNPSFINNTISGTEYGIGIFNVPTSNTVTLGPTNSISGTTKAGIVFTNNLNFNPVDTTNFLAGGVGSSILNISGIVISTTTGTGIQADGAGTAAITLNINFTTILSGGITGLLINGPASAVTGNSINNLSFAGQTGKYISLTNNALAGQTIDATNSSFDGSTGTTKTISQNFATEDRIIHRIDDSGLGFILVKPGNDYVTANSFIVPVTNSPSIQRAIDAASISFTVNLDSGTYNEDININKSLTVSGNSNVIIKGPYDGSSNSVFMSASNSVLKDVTVTRDYGTTLSAWNSNLKAAGIQIGATTSGNILDNIIVTGNKNGIFLNNAQNVTVTSCTIEANRTGILFGKNISGAEIHNNFIRNNFANGVLFNYDDGAGITAANVHVTNNSITGNWYSQVNFQRNTAPPPTGDHTGWTFICNWYGTTTPSAVAQNAAEPDYTIQIPSQFGGTDPGLNRQLYGVEIMNCPYTSWLTNGTDDDSLSPGFQPMPGSCNGQPASTVNIKLIPEGFYNAITQNLSIKDTVKAYLYSNVSPFIIKDSAVSVIDSLTFSGSFQFTDPSGVYYIVIRQRNTIETWSKNGGEIFTAGSTMSYDFTDSITTAFGSNLKRVDSSTVRFGIYSGDVNQDGAIDLSDLILIYNDARIFVTGYVKTDITGDNFTDLTDLIMAKNNSTDFVEILRP